MSDYTLGDTIYHKFTTRAFATGAPTTLAGTPVVSIYEDDSLTQITAGITLTVDFDSVTGLNHLTVVATGGNGFEIDKFYQAVITTGTVDSVSVVGEVVWTFSLGASAAAQDLANATDGLGAIKAETATIVADTNELQSDDVPGLIAALNDVSTADINAQVADVIKTDAISQPSQGAPTATPTLEDAVMYLYTEYVRNKVVIDTNTANQKQVFADDGSTILYEKDLTNASDVTTIAEATTGA